MHTNDQQSSEFRSLLDDYTHQVNAGDRYESFHVSRMSNTYATTTHAQVNVASIFRVH